MVEITRGKVPVENFLVMYETFREYGSYPIKGATSDL